MMEEICFTTLWNSISYPPLLFPYLWGDVMWDLQSGKETVGPPG